MINDFLENSGLRGVQNNAHIGHDVYAELRLDEDEDGRGYIVQMGCRTCGQVTAFMHPKAALEFAGKDSELGKEILQMFPQWS